MDRNLKHDMDETIEHGKAETAEMRADVQARAEEAKADIAAKTDRAAGDVREHLDEVRGEASEELGAAHAEADHLGSTVEREREASHEGAGERIAHEAKGLFDSIKNRFTGSR